MPRWVPDHEFDIDWHIRHIGAPGDGTLRELLDFFGAWLQDPYDRTRPLWQYVVVDGLADGQGALWLPMLGGVARVNAFDAPAFR